jgi:hypothetical protein
VVGEMINGIDVIVVVVSLIGCGCVEWDKEQGY